MDNRFEAEILSTSNALGMEVKGIYEKGTDCLECLKDLLRYLRKDDENHSVLRFYGSIKLLETDLLPLLKRYKDEKEIFDFTLRLMVAVTSPALLLFKEEIPEDKLSNNVYLQLVNYLQSYKKAFLDLNVWEVLHECLEKLLAMRPIERNEEDNLIIERILIVIRNVLHIPSDEMSAIQTDDDTSLQDKILCNFNVAKLDVLILYLCANEDEYKYCLHVLEIISLMFREHSPDVLALASEQRSKAEKEKDLNDLMSVRTREQCLKMKKVQSLVSSRFSGVYCVKNMKSLSERDYISHKLLTNLDNVKFDALKNSKRKPKNRLQPKDAHFTRKSTLGIRLLLKNFCSEFLKLYNKLLAAVRRELNRKSSGDHDDTYYLWAIEFFMKFNRHYKFEPALISETISVQMFHHIQTQITTYHEMMLSDKKKSTLWSKRMKMGIKTYKELLQTVYTMTKSSDSIIQQNADIIVSNVFYVVEYREMLLSLLSDYNETKFSLTYLSELIESTYLFLKMLENHSKRHSDIIVQKRKKKTRKRRKKQTKITEEYPKPGSVEYLEQKWQNVASDLSATVQGRREIPTDCLPFDGASEVPFESQKVDTVYKIRHALVSREAEKAVGLLRAARELWPEGDSFGGADIESEDEFMVLREIFLSNLEDPNAENNPSVDPEENEEQEEETDEETESMAAVTEQRLDVVEVYKKYASPKVVKPCCLLMANYQNNSSQTNISMIKLLHKIAWDCKMHALFFQATLFVTFQKIFQDPDASFITNELYRFAKFILSKFFQVAQKNDKVFVEMLFWKGHREAYELEEGYGVSETSGIRSAWTEDEEEELKYLYEENKDVYIKGQDVADIILANLNTRKRSKHQVILALKRLGLIQTAKDLKPHLRKEWREDEVVELQHLYEDFKGTDDVMGSILNGLSIMRSRKVVLEKMLELNLIQDKKEVLKKRSGKRKNSFNSGSESDSFINNDNDGLTEKNIKRGDGDSTDGEDDFFKLLEEERLRNRIGEGDLSNSGKSKNVPNVWEEQEIMELTTLYNENRVEDNVIDVIINSLTVKRPKKSVIEKLLEIGLIKDKNEVKKKSKLSVGGLTANDESLVDEPAVSFTKRVKNKFQILSESSEDEASNNTVNKQNVNKAVSLKRKTVKRALKVWDEQEVIELKDIFNENQESDDIINAIMSSLTVKRTKQNIIEKLLEIGLIQDKKDIRKKRKSKSTSHLENGFKDTSDSSKKNTKGHKILSDSLNDEDSTLGNKTRQPQVKSSTCIGKGGRRPPKVWDEGEIMELQKLFEKHRDSNDVIGNIISEQSIKRSKGGIIEKLLETRLISDKKEIRKKREFKSTSISKKLTNVVIENTKPNNSLQDFSSDDDNMPLRKILENSKKTGIINIKKKNTIILESSDEELSQNELESNIKTVPSNFSSNYVFSDSSEDEILPLKLEQTFSLDSKNRTSKKTVGSSVNETVPRKPRLSLDAKTGISEVTIVPSNGATLPLNPELLLHNKKETSERRRDSFADETDPLNFPRTMYSDDEIVPLQDQISIQESVNNQEADFNSKNNINSINTSVSFDNLTEKGLNGILSTSLEVPSSSISLQESRHKRKRLRIMDSDESESETRMFKKKQAMTKINYNEHELTDDVMKSVSRKKARIILDSSDED